MGEEGNGQSVAARLENYPASMGVHKPPFCCLSPWQMGSEFVVKCKTGVFQYVVVRFINTILTTVLFTAGLYEEGQYSIMKPFIWMTAVNFVSQSWALYSLFLFFLCAHKELHGMRPFSKFLCIKLIIFFSWWQALLIGVMVRVGRINRGYGHSAQEIAVLIRVTIISCEMLLAAVAFMYAFPISEFPTAVPLGKALGSSRRLARDGRARRLSSTKYTALGQEAAPLSADSPSPPPPLADRLILHASKMLEYWNGAPRAASLSPIESSRVASPTSHSALAARNTPVGLKDSYSLLGAAAGSVSGDSLSGLLNNEESITEEEAPSRKLPLSESGPLASASEAKPPLFAHTDGSLPDVPLPRLTTSATEVPSISQNLRRAHLHRGSYPFSKANAAGNEGAATLISRSSPSFLRRDPASAGSPVSGSQLRSKSTEKHSFALQGVAPSFLAAGRRVGSLTLSRALELDFDRHAAPKQHQHQLQRAEDTCSASSSECSTDGTEGSGCERPSPGADVFNLSTLSYTPPASALGTHSKAKGRARTTGKGHGVAHAAPSSSWVEALWISTLPADLQEDIHDLEAQITELYTTAVPVAQFKRLIKGNNANY